MPVSILTPELILIRTNKRQKYDQFGNFYRAIFAIKPHEVLVLKNSYPSGEIDRIVYDLYEFTEEEIAIVEGR